MPGLPFKAKSMAFIDFVWGSLGTLAAFGVGSGGGKRSRGRGVGSLLVPVGLIALWLLILHLRTHGLPD